MLAREYIRTLVDDKMYTPEMEAAFNRIYRLHIATYLSFPLGVLFGAAVINPVYTGKTSRVVRKIVPLVCGYYFLKFTHNYTTNRKYFYTLKFYDHYPPHMRQYLQTKDHRYLLIFDPKNSPYKLLDEETKKSVY
jgi:hypothetical protein